jgi:hypothetical protein
MYTDPVGMPSIIYNRASSRFSHSRNFILHRQKHSPHVYIHHSLEVFRALLFNMGKFALNAGVIESSIQPAEVTQRFIHHALAVSFLCNIRRDKNSFTPSLINEFESLFTLVLPPPGKCNLGAELGKVDSRFASNACGTPGYQRYFSNKT